MLESNIWKYGVLLVTNKRIFVAIIGAYFLSIPEVNIQTVGSILFMGSITGFLLEVPSGYISDKLGHRKALILARLLSLLSTLFYLLADSIPLLILGSVFMSAGFAFSTGTGSAFMHETLRALGREKDYTKIMGKLSSIGFGVPIILTVLVPFLVGISYKIPFVIALVIDVIGIIAAFSLITPPVTPEHIKEIGITNFRQVMKEGYRLRFFRFALFAGIIGGTLISISGFRAVYQTELGVPVIFFGVLFGAGRAFASLMLAYSGKLRGVLSHTFFYLFELVLYSTLILCLGLSSSTIVILSLFIIMNACHWGLSQINSGHLLEVIKTSKFKATLLSMKELISEIVAAFLALGLGFFIQRYSYQVGFLGVSIFFIIIMTPLYFYIKKYE